MAPAPEVTDPPEIQTVALKVSIHCEGCKKKVKKVLQRVEGVGHIDIDSKQNKVTVTGSANAETLIQKLAKYGKQAEIWPDPKPSASDSSSTAGKSSGEPKEDGKEKDAAASTAIATPPETEQQQQPTKDNNLDPPPPVPVPAASKDNIDAPDLKPSESPAKSEMPISAADSDNPKTKGKNVEIAGDESAARNVEIAINPPASYIMSYNTVRPSISYSHYAPSPAIPLSYATYSNYPPPENYSSYTSVASYPPENYSTESYYGSMEAPAAAEGSYDMFNDENPNACNLM